MIPPGNVYVPRDLDLWLFDPKINGLPELVGEHFYVKFGDPSCTVFLRYHVEQHANRQTDKQTDRQTNT